MRSGALFLWVGLGLLACDADTPRFGAIEGDVVRIENGVGYGPVLVALLELDELRIVATGVSDANGHFRFERLLPGNYTPVIYDEERVVFHLERPRFAVVAGEMVTARIPMTAIDYYQDTGVFLTGQILDAESDGPIAGALVGVIELADGRSAENFSELVGRSGPLVGPSSDSGHFRIGPLPVVVFDFGEGPQEKVPHLRVHHPLYKDAWFGPWDRQSFPPELNIRLERGLDRGVITGTLQILGTQLPAEGLRITAEWQGAPSVFPKLLLTQVSALSDSVGFFALRNLPPGRFLLLPAYPPDDGFLGEFGRTAQLNAADDSVHLAQPLRVAPAISLLTPEDGASPLSVTHFDWADVPTAVEYRLEVVRGEDLAFRRYEELLVSDLTVDEELAGFLAEGSLFRWNVFAFSQTDEVGRGERPNALRR